MTAPEIGNLKAGTTYSVVTTNDFLRVNAAPWQAGAIARGQWQFTIEAGHSAGAPVEIEAFAFPPTLPAEDDPLPPADPLADHPPGMALATEGFLF